MQDNIHDKIESWAPCSGKKVTHFSVFLFFQRRHGIFDREGQASCVIKLSKEEAIQAAAERETKEPLVNEFPENDENMEENIDDTFHVDNRLEDAMEHQVLVPVTDESIEEEIVDNTFIVQTTN